MSELILASASQVRARLLREAGVSFRIEASSVDEQTLKQSAARSDIETLTVALAKAKAAAVAQRHSGAFVIGADQILDCDGRRYDKPVDQAGARDHLRQLRGKTHRLATACVVFRGETALFEYFSAPKLIMRPFSDAFLDDYLVQTGDSVITSVGAYQLEHRGAQLFDAIEGDYFTILGLPLIPLLSFLRTQGLVPA